MKNRILTVACAIAATSASLAVAQGTAVFPSDFTSIPGSSYASSYPFSYGISRVQFIYESFDLNVPHGASIHRLGFRQDEGRTSTGKSVQLSIYMGGTTLDTQTATRTFDNNYQGGTPRTLVFGPAIIALPDFTSTTTLGEVNVDLTAPYTFNAAENLVVEYVITANSNANRPFNYYLDKGTWTSATTTFGQGCASSAGSVPRLGVTPAPIGSNVRFSMDRAPASSTVWLNLSLVPTPPLLGDPFGAPGCTMLVAPIFAIAGTGSTSGTGRYDISIPDDISWYRKDIFGQMLVLDLFANSLGFVASNGAQVTIGANARMATLGSTGDPAATTGSLSRSNGIISLFHYR